MKRIVALVALCSMFASDALATARVLVIGSRDPVSASSPTANYAGQSNQRVFDIVNAILSSTGSNFTIIRGSRINTENARQGIYPSVYFGTGGDPAPQRFDAVIDIGAEMSNASLWSYRIDSLLSIARGGSSVPRLVIFTDRGLLASPGPAFSGGTICTTGVSSSPLPDGGTTNSYVLHQMGKARGWNSAGLFVSGVVKQATLPSNGWRSLVALSNGALVPYHNQNFNCGWCDSTNFALDDTLCMWELPYTYKSGAKPVVMLYPDGAGGPDDSLSEKRAAEVDPALILAGLARLDSLVRAAKGGSPDSGIFDRNKLPLKMAVTLDGAYRWEETGNRAYPSILAADSATFKGSLDSIATINAAGGVPIKLTVGANVDSISARPFEQAWWRKVEAWTRFSPQGWWRLAAVNAGTGTASAQSRHIDIWGKNRNRVIVGDYTTPADSSVVGLLMAARNKLRQTYPNQLSRFALPTLDDWSPKNKDGTQFSDSMLYAIGLAGFSGVRVDGRNWAGSASRMRDGIGMTAATPNGATVAGSLGYIQEEGRYREPFGNKLITVLRHPGYSILGARTYPYVADDTTSGNTAQNDIAFFETYRAWTSLLMDYDTNGDFSSGYGSDWAVAGEARFFGTYKDNSVQFADIERYPVRAHIIRLDCSTLAGRTDGVGGPPARWGYVLLKAIKSQMDCINDFAGRTVVTFDYPENIAP